MSNFRGYPTGFFAITVAVLSIAASHQLSAAINEFQYATTLTSPITPNQTIGGPGSQVSQAGIGNFAAPTGQIFNGFVNGLNGIDLIVGTISVTDLGIGSYVDTYSVPFTLQLKIKDFTSGMTGIFSFNVGLTGRVASNGTTTGSNFNNPFFNVAGQTQVIGATTYSVRIFPNSSFASPGAAPVGGTGLPGEYTFNVLAQTIPEPGTLGLLTFGGLLAALGVSRRKA
jgi:hypothetical protein